MTYIAPERKLLGHLDRLHQIRETSTTSAPVSCELDLSNRCSLACEFCHFGFVHVRGPLAGKREKPAGAIPGGDLMDLGLAKRIIAELANAGVRSLTLTGGGEPTLHPHFDEIVEYAATRDIALGIYTNACHITPERAVLLKETMTFVYVSLDAADAETYKQSKGVDRFAKACDGIRLLADAAGAATIGVGYLVTRENWKSMADAVVLAGTLDADYLQFRPTIRYAQNAPNVPDEDTGWMDEMLPHLEALTAYSNVEADVDRFLAYRDWSGHGYATCVWSLLQTCVTPNGKVWACVSKREHADAEIGDLSTETFEEVWERHTAAQVNGDCRVMCRGHIPNVAASDLLQLRPHWEFV